MNRTALIAIALALATPTLGQPAAGFRYEAFNTPVASGGDLLPANTLKVNPAGSSKTMTTFSATVSLVGTASKVIVTRTQGATTRESYLNFGEEVPVNTDTELFFRAVSGTTYNLRVETTTTWTITIAEVQAAVSIAGRPRSGGGGGLSAVATTGDGLSGDGSAGDPLAVASDLEEVVDDLSVANQTITGVSEHDMVLRPKGDGASASRKILFKGRPNGDFEQNFFEVNPDGYSVTLGSSIGDGVYGYNGVWTIISPETSENAVNFGRLDTDGCSFNMEDNSGDSIPLGRLRTTMVNADGSTTTATSRMDLEAKTSADAGVVPILRLDGDANVADIGTRAIAWGSAIGTRETTLRRSADKVLELGDEDLGTADGGADVTLQAVGRADVTLQGGVGDGGNGAGKAIVRGGAGSSTNGGAADAELRGGVSGGTAGETGGKAVVAGGAVAGTDNQGGGVDILGANGGSDGSPRAGGAILIQAGNGGTGSTGAGGNVTITAGAASNAGQAGNVAITAGNSASGTDGTFTVTTGGTTRLSIDASGVTNIPGVFTIAGRARDWSSSAFADSAVSSVADGHSISIPGATLSNDGDWIEVFGVADMGAGFNGTTTLVFGGTTLVSKAYPGSSGPMEFYGRVVRTGASTQRAWGRTHTSGHNNEAPTYTTPAETLSGAITLKTRVSAYTSGTITYKFLTVRKGNGP